MSLIEGKTGILIHGCHLGASDWETIVFGDQNRSGRVPIGIRQAIDKKAQMIFWGTGASQNSQGQKESEYTFSLCMGEKLGLLAEQVNKSAEELSNYLFQVSYIDKETQNTKAEITKAFEECQKRKIEKIILVSSPFHISRCLRDALVIKESLNYSLEVTAIGSKTGPSPSNVVISEPPHRPDKPNTNEIFRELSDLLSTHPEKSQEIKDRLSKKFKKYHEELSKKK